MCQPCNPHPASVKDAASESEKRVRMQEFVKDFAKCALRGALLGSWSLDRHGHHGMGVLCFLF